MRIAAQTHPVARSAGRWAAWMAFIVGACLFLAPGAARLSAQTGAQTGAQPSSDRPVLLVDIKGAIGVVSAEQLTKALQRAAASGGSATAGSGCVMPSGCGAELALAIGREPVVLHLPPQRHRADLQSFGGLAAVAVEALEGKRILATHAPSLPVPNCSMASECRCRFKKYADRREDEDGRRFKFGGERSAWYAGGQRRKSKGRRRSD